MNFILLLSTPMWLGASETTKSPDQKQQESGVTSTLYEQTPNSPDTDRAISPGLGSPDLLQRQPLDPNRELILSVPSAWDDPTLKPEKIEQAQPK